MNESLINWILSRWASRTSDLHAGILKKKQLSPIVERNSVHHGVHSEPREGTPQGSSSSETRAGPPKSSLPEQLNGVALSIKAGTVDGDSSGSEWVKLRETEKTVCCLSMSPPAAGSSNVLQLPFVLSGCCFHRSLPCSFNVQINTTTSRFSNTWPKFRVQNNMWQKIN